MLKRIEKSPSSLFRRAELLQQSKTRFNKLRRDGFLLYVQPGEGGMGYPCRVLDCGNGCPMEVLELNGKHFAVCPEDDGIEPILLTADDISRYRFSLDKLISEIRRDNEFVGPTYQITPRLHFIGERVINELNNAFIFACFQNIREAEPHLLALPSRFNHSQIVVVTPSLDLSREPIYPRLRAASIFPVTLPESFGRRNFKISYLAALSRRPPAGAPVPVPGLTPSQLVDYEKYAYKCQDRLHIPGLRPQQRRNIVVLNGDKITLADALFALLMRFVVELKKGKGGWIAPSDLVEGGFINDIEHRQRYSQLREHFKGSLREKDGGKFIESNRSKGYRLSTHPDFVSFDKKKLKTHPDPQILELIKRI